MPRIQRDYWMKSVSLHDRVYLGGPFAPPDMIALEEMQAMYEKDEIPRIVFPRMH
jgi:hypothetical protein